jgi:hypothetical protein
MNVGRVLCFNGEWFVSYVAKFFKVFGDGGYDLFLELSSIVFNFEVVELST